MSRIKRFVTALVAVCILFSAFVVTTYAADGYLSITSATGTVGSTVSVTCTATCTTGPIGVADVFLTYDPSALEYLGGSGGWSVTGGSGSVICRGLADNGSTGSLSFTVSFKILKQGAHKISSTGASSGVDYFDEQEFPLSGYSGTVTGTVPPPPSNPPANPGTGTKPQDNRDGNNKLSSLQVYPGTLEPEFDPDVVSYTVRVSEEISEVTISATAQSGKATVAVTGGKDLKPGRNEAYVTVTAENGLSLGYDIAIICGDDEKIKVGGKDYTIDEKFDDGQIPDGFERSKVSYDGHEYDGLKHSSGKVLLIFLRNDTENGFFIYLGGQDFYPFVTLKLTDDLSVIPLPPKGHRSEVGDSGIVTLNVQGKSFDGWKISPEFSVILALTRDGKEVLYRYDTVDGTFQRYTASPVTQKTEKLLFPDVYYMYAVIGLVVLSVVFLCIAVFFIIAYVRRVKKSRRTDNF